MEFKNTTERYGVIAIFFHWVMAILILGLLCIGIYMVRLNISIEKLNLYSWHKEYGYLVLFLACARLLWRCLNQVPILSLAKFEKFAARSVHWLFYFCMFGMPITGWVITSAAGMPASFFGLFVIPAIVAPSEEIRLLFEIIHEWLGYALIVLICMHTAAALKHHFINKDSILRRML